MTSGELDDVPVAKIHDAVDALLARFKTEQKDLLKTIDQGSAKIESDLLKTITDLAKKVAKEFN